MSLLEGPAPTPTFAPDRVVGSARAPHAQRPDDDAAAPSPAPLRPRAVWISDTHLGTPRCKAGRLLDFLQHIEPDTLYLVGDIVDGWQLKRTWCWQPEFDAVVARLFELGARGTRVVYIPGNHDEGLRAWHGVHIGPVECADELVHTTADGRRLLVLHGDRLDTVVQDLGWLAHLGDRLYQVALWVNDVVNTWRARRGLREWPISQTLKQRVKKVVNFMTDFEERVVADARERGLDGAICGHIHKPEMREIDGLLYLNDGDWVESCSALLEHPDGDLELIQWSDVGRVRLGLKPARQEAARC